MVAAIKYDGMVYPVYVVIHAIRTGNADMFPEYVIIRAQEYYARHKEEIDELIRASEQLLQLSNKIADLGGLDAVKRAAQEGDPEAVEMLRRFTELSKVVDAPRRWVNY